MEAMVLVFVVDKLQGEAVESEAKKQGSTLLQ